MRANLLRLWPCIPKWNYGYRITNPMKIAMNKESEPTPTTIAPATTA